MSTIRYTLDIAEPDRMLLKSSWKYVPVTTFQPHLTFWSLGKEPKCITSDSGTEDIISVTNWQKLKQMLTVFNKKRLSRVPLLQPRLCRWVEQDDG